MIKGVRNILFIQQQFDLSEGKLLELRITQIEKTIEKLTSTNQIDQDSLNQINETIEEIKAQISSNNFESATESLRSLTSLLQELEI